MRWNTSLAMIIKTMADNKPENERPGFRQMMEEAFQDDVKREMEILRYRGVSGEPTFRTNYLLSKAKKIVLERWQVQHGMSNLPATQPRLTFTYDEPLHRPSLHTQLSDGFRMMRACEY